MEIPNASQHTHQSSPAIPDPPALTLSPTTLPPPPPSSSLFLCLSPEFRNQIYQHLYTSTVLKIPTDTPGLPLTCKQLYAESTDLLYASTAFYVEDWDTLLRWLKHLPP